MKVKQKMQEMKELAQVRRRSGLSRLSQRSAVH